MAFTNTAEQAALTAVLDGSYVALFTAAPSAESGTGGTEVSGGGYSRKSWTPGYTQGDPTQAANTGVISWSATANWGTVTHAVICSASTGGNRLAILELVDPNDTGTALPKTIQSGDDFQFAIGELVVTAE